MKLCWVGLLIQLATSGLFAEVPISGKIHDMTLVADQNPYIVTNNVVVPSGHKLVITAGCVILFKPFTDITVEGTFIVEGTAENPVVFTSENDTKFNLSSTQFPNPFDWNGILIYQNAEKAQLSNFSVEYSVYGIKSYKTDIIIENGIFNHNGQSNLTINETMRSVIDGIPFSYKQESINLGYTTQGQDTDLQTVRITPPREKKPLQWRKIATVGYAGGGILCLSGSAYYYLQAMINQDKYLKTHITGEMQTYKARTKSSLIYGSICAVPAITLGTIAIKRLINDKKETAKADAVSFSAYPGQGSAFSFVIDF